MTDLPASPGHHNSHTWLWGTMTARYNYAYDDTDDANDNDFQLKGYITDSFVTTLMF